MLSLIAHSSADCKPMFSASQPGSAFARLIAAAGRRAHVLTSDIACAEARRNLALKRRPGWQTFQAVLEELEVMPSAVFPLPVSLDEKDVPLLCAAIPTRSDYFVTGDRRDFGHLFGMRVHSALVITPLRLAEVPAGRVETEEEDQR